MNPTRKLGIFGSRSSIQHVCTECALQAQIKPVKCGSLPLSKLRSRVQYNTIFKKMLHPSLQERHGSNISVAKWDTCPTGLPTLSMQSLVSQSRPKTHSKCRDKNCASGNAHTDLLAVCMEDHHHAFKSRLWSSLVSIFLWIGFAGCHRSLASVHCNYDRKEYKV